jgi:hypothetical protein
MKLLALISALLISLPATASWFIAAETEDGERILGKNGSLDIKKNKNGVWVATGDFAIVVDGEPKVNFKAGIPVETCVHGNGQIALGDDEAYQMFWWDRSGNKIYDRLAKVLCEGIVQYLKRAPDEKSTPSKDML